MHRIEFVRTHYPHWAARSGYSALIPALRAVGGFHAIEERLIESDGREDERLNIVDHDVVMPWYTPASHRAEIELAAAPPSSAPTLIHFMDGEHDYYYSAGLAGRTDLVLVASYHQPPALVDAMGLLGDGRQLQGLDRAIVLCEAQRAHLARRMPLERIEVIPHGVDVEAFSPGERGAQSGAGLDLLCVGFWLRDLELLAEAIEALGQGDALRLHLVGLSAGVQRGAIDRELLARLRALPGAIVHPQISDAALLRLYRECDLLALPLRDATANNALLEAAACGLPIVTTDLPATREYLGEEGAWLAERGSAEAFAEALGRAIGDEEARARSGRVLRERMALRNDWRKIAMRHAEVYRSALEESAAEGKAVRSARVRKRALCTALPSAALSSRALR